MSQGSGTVRCENVGGQQHNGRTDGQEHEHIGAANERACERINFGTASSNVVALLALAHPRSLEHWLAAGDVALG